LAAKGGREFKSLPAHHYDCSRYLTRVLLSFHAASRVIRVSVLMRRPSDIATRPQRSPHDSPNHNVLLSYGRSPNHLGQSRYDLGSSIRSRSLWVFALPSTGCQVLPFWDRRSLENADYGMMGHRWLPGDPCRTPRN